MTAKNEDSTKEAHIATSCRKNPERIGSLPAPQRFPKPVLQVQVGFPGEGF